MAEYILTFFLLLIVSAVLFLLFDRFFKPRMKEESDSYVEALRDLLDGREETAFSKLRQVVAEDSTNIDAYLRLGQILRDNKQPERALQVHKDLTLRGGLGIDQKVEILQQLYYDYAALNNTDMAQAALKELISLRPRDRWAYIQLLEQQKKSQQWDVAYETAVMVLKIEGNKSKKPLAAFKYYMGQELYKKREYHKARILFKEALGFNPEYVEAYLAIGDSYYEEKRFEDAVNFWNKLIEAVPDRGHLVIDRLKTTLFQLGKFGEINQICENILRHSPDNLSAKLCLSEFYEKKGDTERALEILEGVVDDHPEDIRSLAELVRLHLERGDTRKVLELVKRIEQKHQKRRGQSTDMVTDSSLIGI